MVVGSFFQGNHAYLNHLVTWPGASCSTSKNHSKKTIYPRLTCTAICVPLDVASNVTGLLSVVTRWWPCCWCPISEEALWNAAKSWATIATFRTKGQSHLHGRAAPAPHHCLQVHSELGLLRSIIVLCKRKVAIIVFSELSASSSNINILRTAAIQ